MDMEVFLHGLMQASSKRPQQQLQPNMGTSTNAPPQATQVSPSTPIAGSAQTIASGGGPSTPAQASDDSDSRKRKAEGDEDDESKRAKIRKTEEVCILMDQSFLRFLIFLKFKLKKLGYSDDREYKHRYASFPRQGGAST